MPIWEGLYASPESTRELEHPLEATSGDHLATRPVLPIKPPPRIRYSTVPSFSSDAFAVRLISSPLQCCSRGRSGRQSPARARPLPGAPLPRGLQRFRVAQLVTPTNSAPGVADCGRVSTASSTELPRLMAPREADAQAKVSRVAGRGSHRLGAFFVAASSNRPLRLRDGASRGNWIAETSIRRCHSEVNEFKVVAER
jgi:hypothetical protein